VNHLLRSIAPISDAGWELIDDEAREQLTAALAARKLVDFSGPHGWEHSASPLGRTRTVESSPLEGVTATQRKVMPLVELRRDFEVTRDELRDGDRGAPDVDLEGLDKAAQEVARAENRAVFHGFPEAGIVGITPSSPHVPMLLADNADDYPGQVAQAVERLLRAGIGGPYGVALGPGCYTAVIEATEHGGYLVFDHLRKILGGPIVWAPGVDGAVVLSVRGGDYLFESGQDLSVGYDSHDADAVRLYLEESFSFRVATAEASVWLTPSE
jgi:uncharacterized linocin/CFP29 family protein